MNILYHHRIRGIDGQAVHVRALIQAFRRAGHVVREVSLVELAGDASAGRTAPDARARPLAWLDRVPAPVRELLELAHNEYARRRLVRAGRELGAELLYERHALAGLGGSMAARSLAIPHVLEVNSPLVRELTESRGLWFPGLARSLERRALRHADLVIAVSPELAEILVSAGARAERVMVLSNGVDLGAFGAGAGGPVPRTREEARVRLGLSHLPASAWLVGFVGYARDWHRLDLALQALADPRLKRAHLVVVGDGPAIPALRTTAERLHLEKRLHLLPSLPHREIPGALAAFDVGLLAGIPAYASPLKLYEYLAQGLPVVAPDQLNVTRGLEPGVEAVFFPPGDATGLAGVLAQVLERPEWAAELGRRGRAAIAQRGHSWDDNARLTLERVRQLRGPGPPADAE